MKSILRYILLIPVLLFSVACEDYLERMPLDAPSSETFFANETELEMAVTGVYNRLVWNTTEGIPWHLSFDFASDDGWDRNGSPLQALGRGEQNSDNRYTNGVWSHFYRAINRVNFITSRGSHLRNQMDAAKYDRLLGEARFLRAMWYTYLADLYGDVPLVTDVLALADAQTPRASKSQVIDFVLSELDEIVNHLPSNRNEKGRVTKGAVLLLKSRAALWNERWQVAAQAAKQLIDEGTYQLDDNYESMFNYDGDNSPEVLMRIQYMRGLHTHNLPRNFFSRMALGHSNKKPPQQMVDSYGCIDGLSIEVSPLFNVNSPFENRDPRLGYTLAVPGSRYVMNTFETHRDSTTVWNYRTDPPTRVTNIEAQHAFASFTGYLYRKHVDARDYPTDVGSSEQNLTLFRFGEAFLNYAEAKVELNQIDQSVYDALNAIRGRASVNMPPIEQGKTQTEMRNIVRKERRHELGMEGLRYFDIRRWRIAENVMPGPVYGRLNRYGPGGWLAAPPKIDPIGTPSYGHISNANQLTIIETRAFNPARDYVWPIPRIELETNTSLSQNPQY